MARIIGIEDYEYHIVDDKTGETRDFIGYKVYVATGMLPSQGRGLKVSEYPVKVADVPYVFGCQPADLDKVMEKEIYIETVPQGKRQILAKVIPVTGK